MEHVDDLELKAEIDQISKKIDAIIENVQQLDPARNADHSPDQGHVPPDR